MSEIRVAAADGRTAMGRAASGRPFRPYAYGGETEEPPAVAAARERHRANNAEIERRQAAMAAAPQGGANMIEAERAVAGRNGLPGFRPYAYRGTGKDIYRELPGYLQEVTALQRAVAACEESAPDPEPGPEWYREMAAEAGDDLAALAPAAVPAPVAVPVRVPAPALVLADAPEGELAALDGARERYQAAMAAVPEPVLPAPPPVTEAPARPARRHRPCGYLRGSRGCKAVCGE